MGAHVLKQFRSPVELAAGAAAGWLDVIDAANRAGAPHTAALSGGRITSQFFAETVRQARERRTDWNAVKFFWADERCVPPDDPQSNYALAKRELLEPLNIRPEQVHRFRGEANPQQAAGDLEAELRAHCEPGADGVPILDLVFLGMGEDGHVASLFPGTAAELVESNALCVAVTGPKPPPRRVTLTYRTLAAAQRVWVLISGSGKEGALRHSMAGDESLPLGRLILRRRETVLFTDIQEASSPGD